MCTWQASGYADYYWQAFFDRVLLLLWITVLITANFNIVRVDGKLSDTYVCEWALKHNSQFCAHMGD